MFALQELFCEILTPEKQPLSLQLPNIWLWDIIDEFVYQVITCQFCVVPYFLLICFELLVLLLANEGLLFHMSLNSREKHILRNRWNHILIFQFQAFCLYKANPGKRSPEEYEDLLSIEQNQSVCVFQFCSINGLTHVVYLPIIF